MHEPMNLRNVTDLLSALDQGMTPDYLFFWGHRPQADGSIGKGCLSQWFEAPFEVEGERYRSAEHFMMAEKARLFGDTSSRAKILACQSPAEAKKLGRSIEGFDEATWVQVRFGIVVRASQAKFSQNPALRRYLKSTGTQVLVEASPVDAIWGIGLAARDAAAADVRQWRGLNLLGFALMEARATL